MEKIVDTTKRDVEISGCIIFNEENKVCVLWQKEKGHWEFPGGKIEDYETESEAAIREAEEEIGVNIEILRKLYSETIEVDDMILTIHIFLVNILGEIKPFINEVDIFEKLKYIPIDLKVENLAESVQDLFKKVLNREISVLR